MQEKESKSGKGENVIDASEYDMIETAGTGKEPALLHIAEAYLRGYARHPYDKGTSLMPQDQRWTRATKALYMELPAEDQAIIDSYAEDAAPLNGTDKHKRTAQLKRLALLLICKTGLESRHTIILPSQERKV